MKSSVITVKCRPTQEIIDEGNVEQRLIDLFVADVEGYEIEILKGIDFTKNKPTFFLLEIHTPEKKKVIDDFLSNHGYKCLSEIGERDYTYTLNHG